MPERDVVILEEKTSKGFEIELFGKDGARKWQSSADFKVLDILNLIDSMPMRKAEQN